MDNNKKIVEADITKDYIILRFDEANFILEQRGDIYEVLLTQDNKFFCSLALELDKKEIKKRMRLFIKKTQEFLKKIK